MSTPLSVWFLRAGLAFPLSLIALGWLILAFPFLDEWWQARLVQLTGVPSEMLSSLKNVLFLLFVHTGMALFLVFLTVQALMSAGEALTLQGDVVSKIVDILDAQKHSSLPAADVVRLRQDLHDLIARQVATTEERLRSEWRFVVGLIAAVLLATVAVFVSFVTR